MATGHSEADLVQVHLHALADRLHGAQHDLTVQLVDELSGTIDALVHDPSLLEPLRAGVASNLENLVGYLRGEIGGDVPVPAAAAEYARRLAQRESPDGALLRVHRLAHAALLAWAREVTGELLADPGAALAATQAFTAATCAYVDAVSESVTAVYQHHRDRWQAHRNTVRRETVAALLSVGADDVDLAEQALGHRLRQHHLGVLLWHLDGRQSIAALDALEDHLHHLAQALGCEGTALFLPLDRSLGRGWLSLGRQVPVDLAERVAAVEPVPDVAFALGTPAAGAEGFRATHDEAHDAHRVANLGVGQPPAGSVTWYGDPGVRTAALLAVDLPRTRRMVRRTLRGLAADTETNARLRETLLVFLQARESYVAAAARLHLHKNTVRYRVERAVHLRGRPLDEDRLDLELALHACARLSSHVLVPHG